MPTWAQIVLLVAAGAWVYVKGVKKQRPWGKPVLAGCALGLIAALVGVLYWYLIVVLLVGALHGYVKGVRPKAPWGPPVVAACTIGIIVLVLARQLGIGAGASASGDIARAEKRQLELTRAEMVCVGRYLAEKQPDGKALLLIEEPTSSYLRKREGVVREALEEGFGVRLALAAVEHMPPVKIDPTRPLPPGMAVTVEEFDRMVAAHPDCNVIVSDVGLPENYFDTKFSQMADAQRPKLVVVSFLPHPQLQKLLTTGQVLAFVMPTTAPSAVGGPELPDDPKEAFEQNYEMLEAGSADKLAPLPGQIEPGQPAP